MSMAGPLNVNMMQMNAAREAMFRRAARHSRLVRVARLVLPLGTTAAIAGFAVAMTLARTTEMSIPDPQPPAGVQDGRVTMQSPRSQASSATSGAMK